MRCPLHSRSPRALPSSPRCSTGRWGSRKRVLEISPRHRLCYSGSGNQTAGIASRSAGENRAMRTHHALALSPSAITCNVKKSSLQSPRRKPNLIVPRPYFCRSLISRDVFRSYVLYLQILEDIGNPIRLLPVLVPEESYFGPSCWSCTKSFK